MVLSSTLKDRVTQAESARIMDEIVTPISVQVGEKVDAETSAKE